jgi:hypothetical protein
MSIADLGFTVRIARDGAELREACALRARAYGHHLPALAQGLAAPDAVDRQRGTAVLVCRHKTDGTVIGTARLQRNGVHPLPIEASLALPPALAAKPRAEITRLAIAAGAPALVRPMLVKACYLAAVASQTRLLVIGARSPGLIRIYRGLGFSDLLGDGRQVPLAHAGGLPHSVLSFDVVGAERRWREQGHPLYGFMVETWHPDLQLLAEPEPEGEALAPVPATVVPANALLPWRRAA